MTTIHQLTTTRTDAAGRKSLSSAGYATLELAQAAMKTTAALLVEQENFYLLDAGVHFARLARRSQNGFSGEEIRLEILTIRK